MTDTLREERQRLKALDNLGLMNSPPEERFDRLCRLATRLLDTPIAYVSLLDEERQFFKAAVGLGGVVETPRRHSFCHHTIESAQSLYVPDATSDRRFHDNPYVVGDPGVRCYLGEPLFSTDGHAVGTFCILDTRPRELHSEQMEAFRDLAALAERELNLLAQLHMQRKLTELTSDLVSTLDQRESVDTLLDTLKGSVPFHRGAVAVPEGTDWRILSARGEKPVQEVFDPASPPDTPFAAVPLHTIRVAFRYQGKSLGTLWLERTEGLDFSALERELVASFAVQAGLVLENRAILANLFEQSKVNSVGTLAAGVAHEINSPLSAARLNVESALRLVGQDERLRKKLERLGSSVGRAAEIIQTLLQYAGQGPGVSRRCNLDQAVRQTLALLQHQIESQRIEVRFEPAAEVEVSLGPDRLQTIVHHLMQNAIWAASQGDRMVHLQTGVSGDRAVLEVRDGGPGVEETMESRIFDPFFTTRPPGGGVGLGLSVSRRIAEEAGGELRYVRPDRGAVFRLSLTFL